MTTDPDHLQTNGDWLNPPTALVDKMALVAAAKFAAGVQNLCGNRCAEGFGILMYHRVAERTPGVDNPTVNVTPERFREQLVGLLARGFVAWPLMKLMRAQQAGQTIPGSAFAVTFDDGYENNFSHAWPVLRELNVPATIFLATGYLDSDRPFPFDGWLASGNSRVPSTAWRPLSRRQCDEMLSDGLVELGAHTHSHGRFLGRREEFRHDLQLCLDELQNRFGVDRPTFAFPYGDMSPELVDVARQLGVACCASTIAQRVTTGDDVHELGRFYVGQRDTPSMLAAKLSGWYPTLIAAGSRFARPLGSVARALSRPQPNGRPERTGSGAMLPRKAPLQS